jgi:hypothetical protein
VSAEVAEHSQQQHIPQFLGQVCAKPLHALACEVVDAFLLRVAVGVIDKIGARFGRRSTGTPSAFDDQSVMRHGEHPCPELPLRAIEGGEFTKDAEENVARDFVDPSDTLKAQVSANGRREF